MPKLFGLDIDKLVADGIKQAGGVLDVSFTNYVKGTRSATQPSGGTSSTPKKFTAQGFVEEYKDSQIDGEVVVRGDRKVVILGATVSPAGAPAPGATVTVDEETTTIVEDGVTSDPARATYVCQVRKS